MAAARYVKEISVNDNLETVDNGDFLVTVFLWSVCSTVVYYYEIVICTTLRHPHMCSTDKNNNNTISFHFLCFFFFVVTIWPAAKMKNRSPDVANDTERSVHATK